MPTKKPIQSSSDNQSTVDNFFATIIDHLKIDHLLITSDVASNEKKNFYHDMIHGDEKTVVGNLRQTSSVFFIGNIVKEFLTELKLYNRLPNKLALGMSDSKILVWAEINDNDELSEDALLLSEAKVNSRYHNYGFYLNSTIIEKSDNLPIPPHYHKIIG